MGKGHYSSLNEKEYEQLKDFMALVQVREQRGIEQWNQMWGK